MNRDTTCPACGFGTLVFWAASGKPGLSVFRCARTRCHKVYDMPTPKPWGQRPEPLKLPEAA